MSTMAVLCASILLCHWLALPAVEAFSISLPFRKANQHQAFGQSPPQPTKPSNRKPQSPSMYMTDTTCDTNTRNDTDSDLSFYSDEEPPRSLHSSQYTQVLSTILPIATELRQAYDQHFKDPRQPNAARFAWDPWYVSVGDGTTTTTTTTASDEEESSQMPLLPGEEEASAQQTQYSLKRIQTSQFFEDGDLYDNLVEELMQVGRSVGLTAITPPWTSMYTQGDMQHFHTDAPHGPLAFVLSLSKEGDFEGGETIMFQPQILDYWKGFDATKGIECGSILRHIPPFPLGRCIAFDPRIPHGVNRVTGNGQNPQKARVVIHGWFSEPEVCWFGHWTDDEASSTMLDQVLQPLVETLASGEIGRVIGYLAVRVNVNADGSVGGVFTVCDTLQADPEDFRGVIGYDESDRPVMEDAVADVRLSTFETLKDLSFGEGDEGRAVVVPFDFM